MNNNNYYYAMYYAKNCFGKKSGGKVVENSLKGLKQSLKVELKEISANAYDLDVYYEAMVFSSDHTLLYRIVGDLKNGRLYEKYRLICSTEA